MTALKLLWPYRFYLLAFVLGVVVTGVLMDLRHEAAITRLQVAHSEEKQQIAQAAEEERQKIRDRLVRTQEQLLALDASTSRELTYARAENDRLRTLYSSADADRKRLRISVKQAQCAGGVSASSGTDPLGDATSLELSDAAGSAVWHLRQSLIENEVKIEYLQRYICTIRPDPVLCPQAK